MKKRLLWVLFALVVFTVTGCSGGGELKVISFNIRFDNPRDGVNAWPARAELVSSYLNNRNPDLIGMQEVLWHQYEYLQQALQGYSSVAAGRDDGISSGEACPVFYRRDRFEPLGHGTFWLSETPDVPGSLGPGAVLPRIVTWVHLKETSTGRRLHVFNTHFSHVSDSKRIMSSIILSGAVKRISGDGFFVLTGDFNLSPSSRAYRVLTGEGAPWRVLYDSYLMSSLPPAGPEHTFNGFSDRQGDGRIDYIFVPAGTRVMSYETEEVKRDSIYISDHWPVKVLISW